MARSIPLLRGLVVLGVASLALAACGGDDGDAGSGETTQPQTQTSAPPETVTEVEEGDGALVLGTLLPETGSLAFLGPPMFAGVELAVQEINEAGGVLGKDVVLRQADSGDTSTDIASQSADRLIGQKADAIIGAASSSVSLTVIDKITGGGLTMMSPANTSDQFTTYNDKGLYFRTAPPDQLQGRVLGELVVEDGSTNSCILALQDAYGTGLADRAEEIIKQSGGTVSEKIIYDPKAAEYSAEVSQVKAAGCDAVVVIGFDESSKIFAELIKQGMPTPATKWYLVDGNCSNYGDDLKPGTLDGAKCTFPSAEVTQDFEARLKSVNPGLRDLLYGPESYDATILVALAAIAAENDSGTGIASKLQDVSTEGEKCTAFADCVKLLEEGTDIDYDGVGGPIEFSDAGDPTKATIAINQYGPDNTFKPIDYREGTV